MSPALAGRFLTTAPPGKSLGAVFMLMFDLRVQALSSAGKAILVQFPQKVAHGSQDFYMRGRGNKLFPLSIRFSVWGPAN